MNYASLQLYNPYYAALEDVAAQGWSPVKLPNLKLWLDVSDRRTLFQDSSFTTPVVADGDPVGGILDKSGNGNHFIQTVSANRPIYQTDGNRSWVNFNGINHYWVSATSMLGGMEALTVAAGVYKYTDIRTNTIITNSYTSGDARSEKSFVISAPSMKGANSYRNTLRGLGTNDIFAGTGVFAAAPDLAVILTEMDLANFSVNLIRNGVLIEDTSGTEVPLTFDSGNLAIGAYIDGAVANRGDLFQICVTEDTISSSNKELLNTFIASKLGFLL